VKGKCREKQMVPAMVMQGCNCGFMLLVAASDRRAVSPHQHLIKEGQCTVCVIVLSLMTILMLLQASTFAWPDDSTWMREAR
jgi:hypothetical protein